MNRFAGTGFQAGVEGRIISKCEQVDVECTIEYTQSPRHATELSSGAKDRGFKTVVAVGGDGTINEVAQGLVHGDIPMGIIPRGSGNGLARHLGIPIPIHRAIANIFSGTPVRMDTFRVNDLLSLNVSGIGFDGHVANIRGVSKEKGLMGYVKLAMQEFARFREFDVDIELNEVVKRKAFFVAIANSSQYGNNALIAPHASVCDGVLDIRVVKKIPGTRLDLLIAFFTGMFERSPYCEIYSAKTFRIHTPEPTPFHVDGEACGVAKEFQIQVIPASLPVLVPITDRTNPL